MVSHLSISSDADAFLTLSLPPDFYKFLASFYKVFPELVTKDLYISGESYAGFYIPYIATRIFNASPAEQAATPLKLKGLL